MAPPGRQRGRVTCTTCGAGDSTHYPACPAGPPSAVEAFRAGARWALTSLRWCDDDIGLNNKLVDHMDRRISDIPHLGPWPVEINGERFTFDERSGGYFRAYPEDAHE